MYWIQPVPTDFIDTVFAVMALSPHLTYQILTKRPQRMLDYLHAPVTPAEIRNSMIELSKSVGYRGPQVDCFEMVWPLSNIWIGVSVENQNAAEDRIPALLNAPVFVRFLSCEPLLGPVDLTSFAILPRETGNVDWVIVGGESGPKARPCDLANIAGLIHQCQGRAFLFLLSRSVRDL